MKIEHWVEYWYPGSFVSESANEKLNERSEDEAIRKMKPGAYAFMLYDLLIKTGKLEDGEEIEKKTRQNESGMFYPQGQTFDAEEVAAMGPKFRILHSNMTGNGYALAVKTRRGNFQPFREGDVLIP